MTDAAAFAALEDLKGIMLDLREAALVRQKFFGKTIPFVLTLIWAFAAQKRKQFDAYLDRLRFGLLRPPRRRKPRAPEAAAARAERPEPKPADPSKPPRPSRKLYPPLPGPAPRRFGWMLDTPFPPGVIPPIRDRLAALLQEDRLRALLALAPQIGRQLRPVCRGLGIDPTPELRLPGRPRKPRPSPRPSPRGGEGAPSAASSAVPSPLWGEGQGEGPRPEPPPPQMTFIPTAEQLRDRDRDRARWRRWFREI